jgi:uncharacterized protein YcfJ
MKRSGITAVFVAMGLLQGCANTPEQQKLVGCAGATIAGAVVGGALGNQLGGGSGKDILTAGGAVAGGLAANNAAGC